MKSIKKENRIVVYLFTSVMLFTSCNKFHYQDITENNVTLTRAQISNYTGEDLFKSIFFGLGEFGQNIELLETNAEYVSRLNPGMRAEYTLAINTFIESLVGMDQNFFNEFESQIKSGEHNEIERALKEGSQLIFDNLDLLFPDLQSKVEDLENYTIMQNLSLSTLDELNEYISEIQSDEFLEDLL